jgi:hypothetical protein
VPEILAKPLASYARECRARWSGTGRQAKALAGSRLQDRIAVDLEDTACHMINAGELSSEHENMYYINNLHILLY